MNWPLVPHRRPGFLDFDLEEDLEEASHADILAEFLRLEKKAEDLKFKLKQQFGIKREEFSLEPETTKTPCFRTTSLVDVDSFLAGVAAQKKATQDEARLKEASKRREEQEEQLRAQKIKALGELKEWLENSKFEKHEKALATVLYNEFFEGSEGFVAWSLTSTDVPHDAAQFDSCNKMLVKARNIDLDKAKTALAKLTPVSLQWAAIVSKWDEIKWVYNSSNRNRKIQAILKKAKRQKK